MILCIKIIALIFAAYFEFGCVYVSPDAGEEAVLIDKPYVFGHGGLRTDPVKTGRSIEWFSTNVVYVNMQPAQFSEHFDDLMSLDGVPLDFDAVIRMQVKDSIDLIKNFGEKWYDNNMKAEFRNDAKDVSGEFIGEIDNGIFMIKSNTPIKVFSDFDRLKHPWNFICDEDDEWIDASVIKSK